MFFHHSILAISQVDFDLWSVAPFLCFNINKKDKLTIGFGRGTGKDKVMAASYFSLQIVTCIMVPLSKPWQICKYIYWTQASFFGSLHVSAKVNFQSQPGRWELKVKKIWIWSHNCWFSQVFPLIHIALILEACVVFVALWVTTV